MSKIMELPFVLPKPLPAEVKVEETPEIIDLDFYKTPLEAVKEWDDTVNHKFKQYILADSEQNLDTLMKWYIQSLKDEAANLEDFETLKISVVKHLYFFKLYFTELNCCFADNYLDNMEDILTFYCNVEIKALPSKGNTKRRVYKKIVLAICHRIISMLSLYLMNREDRMFHVVMKVRLNKNSEEAKELLNHLYGNFLTKKPTNMSDLAFCRAYILYQQWKIIRKPEEREEMDKVMYEMYGRSPKSIQTNTTLRQILMPESSSLFNLLQLMSNNTHVIANEYFKYIKSKNIQDDSEFSLDMDNSELDDRVLPDMVDDGEDEEFNKEYNKFVKFMSSISVEDDPGDCQIVGVSAVGFDSELSELVHEVASDEDDDIVEIIYFTPKNQNVPEKEKTKEVSRELSFLDSIQITESNEASDEKVSSTISSNTAVKKSNLIESLNKPKRDCLSRKSAEQSNKINKISSSTSTIDRCTSLEKCDIGTSFKGIDIENECSSNSDIHLIDTDTTTEDLKTPVLSKTEKNVVSIETQTEDFSRDASIGALSNCQCSDKDEVNATEKAPEQPNICYLTPPSDQPFDEHNRITESPLYPDIFMVRNSDCLGEMDCNAKESENDYVPSSVEESDTENDKLLDSGNRKPVSGQSNSMEDEQMDENSNLSFGMQFEPDLESNGKMKCNDANVDQVTEGVNTDDLGPNEEDSWSSELDNVPQTVSEACPVAEIATVELPAPTPVPTDAPCTSSDACTSVNILKKPSQSSKDALEVSPSALCTSTHLVQKSNDFSFTAITIASDATTEQACFPDITSTSVDVQDDQTDSFSTREGDAGENQSVYEHLEENDPFLESYCEEYLDFTECNDGADDFRTGAKNVSQSNTESGTDNEDIFIEPIGATVDVRTDDFEDFMPSSSPSPNNALSERTNSESVNNDKLVKTPASPIKGLRVTVEKINLSNHRNSIDNAKNVSLSPKKVVFTLDKFTEFERTNHLLYEKLKEKHDLDDILNGPIQRELNGKNSGVNPYKNFDLFDSKLLSPSVDRTLTNSSANTSMDITSPAYEGIDDFRRFFEENKKNGILDMLPTDSSDKANSPVPVERNSHLKENNHNLSVKIFPKNLNTLQKVEVDRNKTISEHNTLKPIQQKAQSNLKSKRIVFAGDVIELENVHSPTETGNTVLQSILKKPSSYFDDSKTYRQNGKRMTRPRIPRRLMNLKSLAQYSVKPNDTGIQSELRVVVKKLSDSDVSKWLELSEISRQVRIQKQQTQCALMQSFRVDYGNNKVRFQRPLGTTTISVPDSWRSSVNLESKSSRLDEGMVAPSPNINFNDKDYNSIPLQCKNTCCNRLSDDLTNLNVSLDPPKSVIHGCTDLKSFPCQHSPNFNPFLLKARSEEKIRPQELDKIRTSKFIYSDILSFVNDNACNGNERLDEHFVSNTNENFKDILTSNLTFQSNFDAETNVNLHQPAIVPEIEEFEKTIKQEELAKSCIPSDLYNLNLRKFSPSPVINCFSPQSISPSHTFQSENTMNDKIPSLQDDEDLELKAQIENIIKSTADSYDDETLDVGSSYTSNVLCSEIKINDGKLNFDLNYMPNFRSFKITQPDKSHNLDENKNKSIKKSDAHRKVKANNLLQDDLNYVSNVTKSNLKPKMETTEFKTNDINLMLNSDCRAESNDLRSSLDINYVPNCNNFDSNLSLQLKDESNIKPPTLSQPNEPKVITFRSDLELPTLNNKSPEMIEVVDFNIPAKEEPSELTDINENSRCEVLTKLDLNQLETGGETRLPLKKRKLSVANAKDDSADDDFIDPDLVEEIIKRARAEEVDKEEISYPAKPMISIAEIQEKLPPPRPFKTPAERKEMPPALPQAYASPQETPKIITEQYNNHTYNNPTINYHMNNVPYPFFPCASLPYFPPILLPMSSTTTFDMNLVGSQQQSSQQQAMQAPATRPRRERKSRKKK